MEKRKKNGASLPGRRIFTGYSCNSPGFSCLNPASAIFLLFSTDIPRNILTLCSEGLKFQVTQWGKFANESSDTQVCRGKNDHFLYMLTCLLKIIPLLLGKIRLFNDWIMQEMASHSLGRTTLLHKSVLPITMIFSMISLLVKSYL